MAKPLKDYFGPELAAELGEKIVAVEPGFDRAGLLSAAQERLEPLELKGRVAAIAEEMRARLPDSYSEALEILVAIMGPENPDPEAGAFNFGYWLWPVGTFIELYGTDDFEASMQASYELTKRHTAEFAVRPLIEADPDRALGQFGEWVNDPNSHVRRLLSEGTRPRLPWAKRLAVYADQPEPVLALLEQLRADPSKYVRNSVANHMGDLLKDDLELAWTTLERWAGEDNEGTRWIVRHATRNPRKHENPRALALFGD